MQVNSLNDEMGHSTCTVPREFHYVRFYCPTLWREMVQWAYRDSRGGLHQGLAPDLSLAINQAELASHEEVPA